jgi:hypothetical protein
MGLCPRSSPRCPSLQARPGGVGWSAARPRCHEAAAEPAARPLRSPASPAHAPAPSRCRDAPGRGRHRAAAPKARELTGPQDGVVRVRRDAALLGAASESKLAVHQNLALLHDDVGAASSRGGGGGWGPGGAGGWRRGRRGRGERGCARRARPSEEQPASTAPDGCSSRGGRSQREAQHFELDIVPQQRVLQCAYLLACRRGWVWVQGVIGGRGRVWCKRGQARV